MTALWREALVEVSKAYDARGHTIVVCAQSFECATCGTSGSVDSGGHVTRANRSVCDFRQLGFVLECMGGGLSVGELEREESCQRRALAREVYEMVIHEVQSVHSRLGYDLAYLMGQIVGGSAHELAVHKKRDMLVRILRERCPSEYPVWMFIKVED